MLFLRKMVEIGVKANLFVLDSFKTNYMSHDPVASPSTMGSMLTSPG